MIIINDYLYDINIIVVDDINMIVVDDINIILNISYGILSRYF